MAFTAFECLLEGRSSQACPNPNLRTQNPNPNPNPNPGHSTLTLTLQAFERQLYYDALKGVSVGQINHSDDFFFSYRDSIFTELQHRLKTYLETAQPCLGGQRPPFCVVADKMTTLRRTNQMVGLLLIDYSTGQMVPMLVGTRLVTDGSGKGTAENIMEVLTKECNLQPALLKVQVSGQGYDGAYHHCSVPVELAKKLGHPSEKLTLPGWEFAHQIELVLNDTRTSVTWCGHYACLLTMDRLTLAVHTIRLYLLWLY